MTVAAEITPQTFALYGECFRCHGFSNAFSRFGHIAGGRCLSCGGGRRQTIRKAYERLGEFQTRRDAERDLATIKTALDAIGSVHPKDENGKRVSRWGFAEDRRGDDLLVLCAAVSRADAKVRARAWAAFQRATTERLDAEKGAYIRERFCYRVSMYTGIPAADVPAWLGSSK